MALKAARRRYTNSSALCSQSTSITAEVHRELVARTLFIQLCSHACASLWTGRAKFKLASSEPGKSLLFKNRALNVLRLVLQVREGEGKKNARFARGREPRPCWHTRTMCGVGSLFLRFALICHLVLSLQRLQGPLSLVSKGGQGVQAVVFQQRGKARSRPSWIPCPRRR